MGFRINTNIAAMSAHTNATMNNRNINDSLSKLSSGLRINTASDDASGLAIANSLRSQASSLGQSVSNGNDAIGLIQTADGALSEYSNILDTIKTKATQAASDTQNTASRVAIQKDIDKLMEELDTIAKTTSFNGQKLLSGTYTNKEFQMGSSGNESVKVDIASAQTNTVGHTSTSTLDLENPSGGSVALSVQSSITGDTIQMKEINISQNNNPDNGMGALADEINKYSGQTGITAKAVVETDTAGAVTAGSTGSDFAINGVTIGSVVVEDNDKTNSLLSAINDKSTQTGVSATLNQDGSLKLSSNDGRAIKVTGDTSDVLGGSTNADMSTVGHLELTQTGAADFQITNKSVGALGADLTIDGDTDTTTDSVLAAGSTLKSGSTLTQGSTIGGDTIINGSTANNVDSLATVESTITSGSVFKDGSTLGGKFTQDGDGTLTADMTVAAGSVLASGTTLAAGTIVTTAFSSSGDTYNVGDVLNSQVTVSGSLTLAEDMTVKFSTGGTSQNSMIGSGSVLDVGSTISYDMTTDGDTILETDMTIKKGGTLSSASTLKAGSNVGVDTVTDADVNVTLDMNVATGSTLASATVMTQASTLGSVMTVEGDTVMGDDMSVKAGSVLQTGTILKAGTTMNEDATLGGIDFRAGDTLQNDITLDAALTLARDMTILGGSTIGSASTLEVNDGKSGTIQMGETETSTLADIDVTTMEGAMKAIDIAANAITDLDSIRSDLGSTQNQITSTINNISVTQVNVKAAESQLRDVDFASESANFSKFNILAQSGSYAMSQANSVQQNVMKLLQ